MSQDARISSIERKLPVDRDGESDDDLIPVFAIAWVASVARIAAAVARGEVFGAEATLALLAVVLLPLLIARARVD